MNRRPACIQNSALSRALIAKAAERTQVVVVTHSPQLIAALEEQLGCHSIKLEKSFGETVIARNSERKAPNWKWPAR